MGSPAAVAEHSALPRRSASAGARREAFAGAVGAGVGTPCAKPSEARCVAVPITPTSAGGLQGTLERSAGAGRSPAACRRCRHVVRCAALPPAASHRSPAETRSVNAGAGINSRQRRTTASREAQDRAVGGTGKRQEATGCMADRRRRVRHAARAPPPPQGNLSRGRQGSSRLVVATYCSYAGCPPYRSRYDRSSGGTPAQVGGREGPRSGMA